MRENDYSFRSEIGNVHANANRSPSESLFAVTQQRTTTACECSGNAAEARKLKTIKRLLFNTKNDTENDPGENGTSLG